MPKGPDFLQVTKEILAKRAGQMCSNPKCRKSTSGPHTEDNKFIILGEAAHIKASRKGQARFDPNMTDDERSDIQNGIWLCRECARKIDRDERKFTVELLYTWKKVHEEYISSGKPMAAAREIEVSDGGFGSLIQNTGGGIGLDINHEGTGPAERISVKGEGIGEIITNTGQGIGKRITKTGEGTASENEVIVNKPVRIAFGMGAKIVIATCSKCGNNYSAQKVIQGFAGDDEPKVMVNCPRCGTPIWI